MNWNIYLGKLLDNLIGWLNPSWPMTTLILGVISLYMFRGQIRALLQRIQQIGPSGITVSIPEQQLGIGRGLRAEDEAMKLLAQTTTSPVNAEAEEWIKKHLTDSHVTDPEAVKTVLVRYLANLWVSIRCERFYNAIFGTQITLLKMLNQNRQGWNKAELELYFSHVTNAFPDTFVNWNAEMYVNYLLTGGAVMVDSGSGNYRITEFGVEFLGWMQRFGMSENRPS